MSASDNDSIDSQSEPSSLQSPWESQPESGSLMNSNYEIIQPDIEYEADGTVSSVNSEDLDQDWEHFRSPSPRSPMIPPQLLSTHDSETSDNRSSVDDGEDHSKLFDLEHSASSSFISRFTKSSQDGSDTTSDSLATLCLPYTFPDPTHNPDPTDNKLSDPSTPAWLPASEKRPDADPFQEHDSFTLYDQTASELGGTLYERSPTRSSHSTHVSHWPDLYKSDGPASLIEIHSPDLDPIGHRPDLASNPRILCTSRSSNMARVTSPAPLSDSITAFHQLNIYLFGKPMPKCEIRTFLKKLRTNFVARSTLETPVPQHQSDNRHEYTEAMIGLSDQYRTVIARSLGSTSQPVQSQLMRQTSDLEIILHDFTRLSEKRAHLHATSLPAQPALVVYRVDPSTFTMPRWLPPFLLSRRGGNNLMMLMLTSVLPSEPDINISVNTSLDSDSADMSHSSEECVDALQSDHPDLSHQILRCTDPVRSPSSIIMDLHDVDKLSPNSIVRLRRLRVSVQSPKPTLLKSTILSISVLVFSAMLMSWFTFHSRQSLSSPISFSACQGHPIIHSLVPTPRSSCIIDFSSSVDDSVLPGPAQQVNSLRFDTMPILSKDFLSISEDPTQDVTPEQSTKSKSEPRLRKSSSNPDTESKFPSGFSDPECSVANSSSRCKEGVHGQAKSDKPGPSSFIHSFISHHSSSFSNQSLFRVSYTRLSSVPKLVKQAVVSSGPNVMKRSRNLVHHSNLLNTLSEAMNFENTHKVDLMLEPTKIWAHRLPKRLRQGLRNLQHRPDACLNVIMNASLPPSRALGQLPMLGREWVRRNNIFQQAFGDFYPF